MSFLTIQSLQSLQSFVPIVMLAEIHAAGRGSALRTVLGRAQTVSKVVTRWRSRR